MMQWLACTIDTPRVHWGDALFVIAVLACLVWNGRNRARWAADAKGVVTPEQRFGGYDARDLEQFKQAISRELLESYIRILRSSDIAFAIMLSAVTAWLWYVIASMLHDCVWVNWAPWPFAAMAILYGVADVAEDLKLSTILKHPGPADIAETAAASTLTRVKIATLIMSLIGAVIFKIYEKAESAASRRMPERAPA
jgi:hypothetical protein